MKTLKQQLKEIFMDDESWESFGYAETLRLITEWLEQKRLKPCHAISLDIYQITIINIFIDELLEELKS